jgi:hypothetical protein
MLQFPFWSVAAVYHEYLNSFLLKISYLIIFSSYSYSNNLYLPKWTLLKAQEYLSISFWSYFKLITIFKKYWRLILHPIMKFLIDENIFPKTQQFLAE